MEENTVELELSFVLPGLEPDWDGSLRQLEYTLQSRKGILRAHLENEKEPLEMCLHYDPNVLTLTQVKRLARREGVDFLNRYRQVVLSIEGMDCSDCALVIEHSFVRMDGILSANVNYVTQKVRIEYDRRKTNRKMLEKRIQSLGYSIRAEGIRSWLQEHRRLVISLSAGILLIIAWVGETFLSLPIFPARLLYIFAYLFGGWDVSRHAWYAIRARHLDTDILMVVAALGSAALGEFAEGALLLFLFSLGHALEGHVLDRARNAVRELGEISPKTAILKKDSEEIEIPIDYLKIDDLVLIRPGTRSPVDGIVIKGISSVDQSPVTGESIPVEKAEGDWVFAGSVNGEGLLEVQVKRLARDSTISRIMSMVEEAQTQKTHTQRSVEKFGRVFVPVVLMIAISIILIPPLFGVPFKEAFMRAMSLLVAASPCALVLGTPATVLAGIARAARTGVLVKGGLHLENLGRLKTIAFDKTGTITQGYLEVKSAILFEPSRELWLSKELGNDLSSSAGDSTTLDVETDLEILQIAASLENRSAHPIAQAVVHTVDKHHLELLDTMKARELAGKGMEGEIAGKEILVGSLSLMAERGVDISPQLSEVLEDVKLHGKSILLVAVEGKLLGGLTLADNLRPDIAKVVDRLKGMGIDHTLMLTGDHEHVAKSIAKDAGLTEVYFELMPEEKLNVIQRLLENNQWVGMVGDGINDAPALACATVGIAMGGASTDVALETADVVLMSDDLSKLPFVVGLGRATRNVILQNLMIAIVVILTLVIASIAGWAGIGSAIILHEGSTLLVVLNALRLLGYQARV